MPKPIAREKAPMQYKTIVLEFLQDQYPALHDRLQKSRSLLQAMEDYALSLKRHHESWMDRLALSKPDSDPVQIRSQALELALEDLRDDLRCESAPADTGDAPLSLDEAMSYLRNPTPRA
jgi:hypothetical protein